MDPPTVYVPVWLATEHMSRSLAIAIFNLARTTTPERIANIQVIEIIEGLIRDLEPTGDFEHLREHPEARSIPVPRRAVPDVSRLRVLERDGHRCLNCGSKENLHVDHVVPISAGGLHAEENFQTLCASCNSRKGVEAVDYRLDELMR